MKNFVNYILLFLLLATSGFPFFYWNQEWIVISLLISLFVAWKKKIFYRVDSKFIFIIILFALWESVQFIVFGSFSFRPILGTISRLLFAYLVIKILDNKIIPSFITIITFFAGISLFFYLLFYIPNITDTIIQTFGMKFKTIFSVPEGEYIYRPNLLIFNFHGFELYPMRNSGPFWEPGAFAIFLCISLVFTFIIKKTLFSFASIIQIIALLTTLSTTGYIILLFIILGYLYYCGKKINWKTQIIYYIVFIPLFTFSTLYMMKNLDFLLPKVEENIANAEFTTSSRFGSALADYMLIKENPILGYGRNIDAMYGDNKFNVDLHRNNGLTKIVVTWGILAILYFYYVFISFKRVCSLYRTDLFISPIFPFVVLLIGGFSEGIFQFPFFWGLMFLQFIGDNKTNGSIQQTYHQ